MQRQTVVLLGASNLTIGWHTVLHELQSRIGCPLNLFVAMGMGRSYVDWSRFGPRELPGITRCQLFDELAVLLGSRTGFAQPATDLHSSGPPMVLLTDIGNDLIYGQAPERIVAALLECLDRIQNTAADSRILMTGLPVSSVMSLGRLRFLTARSLLFPGCRLSLQTLQQRSRELNALVRQTADARGAVFVEPLPQWYGVDPIHIRRPMRHSAFRFLFSHWPDFPPQPPPISDPRSTARLPTVAERRVFGRPQRTLQPCVQNDKLRLYGF